MTEKDAIARLAAKGFSEIEFRYGNEVLVQCERRGNPYRSAVVTTDRDAGRAGAVEWLTTH